MRSIRLTHLENNRPTKSTSNYGSSRTIIQGRSDIFNSKTLTTSFRRFAKIVRLPTTFE